MSSLLTLSILDELAGALLEIERDAVPRVTARQKWRRWRYDQLAELAGVADDWRHPGRFRLAMVGGGARLWMLQKHRLWWTRSESAEGLLFTADPRTGMSWDRRRIGERIVRDAKYLRDAARRAAVMQPTFRPTYFETEKSALVAMRAGRRLQGNHRP